MVPLQFAGSRVISAEPAKLAAIGPSLVTMRPFTDVSSLDVTCAPGGGS
jgi:hypothetical protein